MTLEQRKDLSHNVFDDIEGWQDKSEDDERFTRSVEKDLGKLAVSNFESPGEKDDTFGQFSETRKAIRRSPTAFDSQRNPPRPKFED